MIELPTPNLEPDWYELKDDDTVKFLLRPLKNFEMVNATLKAESGMGDMFIYTCRLAIQDWQGIEQDGEAKEFEPSLIELLPGSVLAEVSGAAMRRSRLTKDAKKN